MKFTETPLAGAYVIDIEPITDDRGFFARSFSIDEFEAHGLCTSWPQENVSLNPTSHTMRGMHFNAGGAWEEKTVTCTAGALFDVFVDLRADSATRYQWFGVELTAENRTTVYVPKGFGHGYLTLAPDTEIRYRMGRTYRPGESDGFRYDDPSVGIVWPAEPALIGDRDRTFALISEREGVGA